MFFIFSGGCFAQSPEVDFNRGLAEAKALHYEDAILAFGRALNRAEKKADIEKIQLALALVFYERSLQASSGSVKYAHLQVAQDYLIELKSKGELPKTLRTLLETIRLAAAPLRESTNKELITLPWEPFAKQISGYTPQSPALPPSTPPTHGEATNGRKRAEEQAALEAWVRKTAVSTTEEELEWENNYATSALDALEKEQIAHPVDRYSGEAPRLAWLALRLAEIRAETSSKLASLDAAKAQDFEAHQRAKESEAILQWLQAKAPRKNPNYPGLTKLLEQSCVTTEKSAFLPIPYRTAEKTLDEKDGHFQAVHAPKARYYRLLLAHALWKQDYSQIHAANAKSLRSVSLYTPLKPESESTNQVLLSEKQSGSEKATDQESAAGIVGSKLASEMADIDQRIQKAVENLPPQTPPTVPTLEEELRRKALLGQIGKLDFTEEPRALADAHRFLRQHVEKQMQQAKPDVLARAEDLLRKDSTGSEALEKLFQEGENHWKDFASLPELKDHDLTRLKVAELLAGEVPLETKEELLRFRDDFLKDAAFSPEHGKTAWKMLSEIFSAHSLPTNTIGDLAKTRALLTERSEPSPSGVSALRAEDKDSKTPIESPPQDLSDQIGVNNRKGNTLMGVYAPPARPLRIVQNPEFRVLANRQDHSPQGVPPTPEPKLLTSLADKIWVRHLLPASGRLSLPAATKPERVLLEGKDVTSEVKYDANYGTYLLPGAKGQVEIEALGGVRPTYESIQEVDAATRAFYLQKSASPALQYPESFKKRLAEIKKERDSDRLGTDQDKDLQAANKVIEWMKENFTYSTAPHTAQSYQHFLERASKDPSLTVLNHLIATKEGDCDVFNSFFVRVLNEELQIPARGVSGYMGKGGKFGSADAHGWSEIWIGNRGWVTTDATVPERSWGSKHTAPFTGLNKESQDTIALYRCLKQYAVDQIERSHSTAVLDWIPADKAELASKTGCAAHAFSSGYSFRSITWNVAMDGPRDENQDRVLALDWQLFLVKQLQRKDLDFSKIDTYSVLFSAVNQLAIVPDFIEWANAVGNQLEINRIDFALAAVLLCSPGSAETQKNARQAIWESDLDKGFEAALLASLARGVTPNQDSFSLVFPYFRLGLEKDSIPLTGEKLERFERNWNRTLTLLKRSMDKGVVYWGGGYNLALKNLPPFNPKAFWPDHPKEKVWDTPNFTPAMQKHFVQTIYPLALKEAANGPLQNSILPFDLSDQQKTELLSAWIRTKNINGPGLKNASLPERSSIYDSSTGETDPHFRSFFLSHFGKLPVENYSRLLQEAETAISEAATPNRIFPLIGIQRVLTELILKSPTVKPTELPEWMDRIFSGGPTPKNYLAKTSDHPLAGYMWSKENIWRFPKDTPRDREKLRGHLDTIDQLAASLLGSHDEIKQPLSGINRYWSSLFKAIDKPDLQPKLSSSRSDATQLWEMLQNIPDPDVRKRQFKKMLTSFAFDDRDRFLTTFSNLLRTNPDPAMKDWIVDVFTADMGSQASQIKSNPDRVNQAFPLELAKMRLWTQAGEDQRKRILHNGQSTKLLNGLQGEFQTYRPDLLPLFDSILAPAHEKVLETYYQDLKRETDPELLDSRIGSTLGSFLEWRSRFTSSRKESSALIAQSEAFFERRAKQKTAGKVPDWWKDLAPGWFKSHIALLPLSDANAENYQSISRALTHHHLLLKQPPDAARDFNMALHQFATQAFRLPPDAADTEAILHAMTESGRQWIPQLSHPQRSALALHAARLWMEAAPAARAFYADAMERCISDLPRRELHQLMPALWHLAKASQKPGFTRLIAAISLKPKVMDKLDSEEEHVERRQSDLQRAPLELLKAAIGPAAVLEPYRMQTPQQQIKSLHQGPLSTLLRSPALGRILLETKPRPNPLFDASRVALSPADRLELLAGIAGRGWVSASVLASAIDTLPDGTKFPEATLRALLAGVAENSMATASRVLKDYQEPEAFLSMSVAEQMDYIQKEKPPLNMQVLKLLNQSLSRFGQTLTAYPSAFPPVEERADR